jgi:hypothetical protein
VLKTLAAFAAAASLSSCAVAQTKPAEPRVYTENGDSVVAFDRACTWKEFNDSLKDQYKGKARLAIYIGLHVGNIPGCYVEDGGKLLFLFADGDGYAIPVAKFTRQPAPKPAPAKPKGVAI